MLFQAFFLSTDRKQQEHNIVILVSAVMLKCGLCSFLELNISLYWKLAKYFMCLMGNFLAPYGLETIHLHIPQSTFPTSDCAIVLLLLIFLSLFNSIGSNLSLRR